MGHKLWVENCKPLPCSECEFSAVCYVDIAMPCSPDCEGISERTNEPLLEGICEGCPSADIYRDEHLGLEQQRHT